MTTRQIVVPIADDPTPPAQPFKKQTPCSGPNCSRSPVAPAPAPVAPTAPNTQEWACMFAPALTSARNSSPYTPEDQRELPFSAGSSIYHPPR
jgi:hypothetical protein